MLALEDNRLYTTHVRFEWDPPKAEANLRTHRVSFAEAVTFLEDEFALTRDDADEPDESRFVTLGLSQRRESARRGVRVPWRRCHTPDLGMEGEQAPEDAI
ncbi:MAG: BrnT family toxin [bacterium]